MQAKFLDIPDFLQSEFAIYPKVGLNLYKPIPYEVSKCFIKNSSIFQIGRLSRNASRSWHKLNAGGSIWKSLI